MGRRVVATVGQCLNAKAPIAPWRPNGSLHAKRGDAEKDVDGLSGRLTPLRKPHSVVEREQSLRHIHTVNAPLGSSAPYPATDTHKTVRGHHRQFLSARPVACLTPWGTRTEQRARRAHNLRRARPG